MDTFDDYVARCAVQMFEAAGGSSLWSPKFTAGELHMKPLGNAVLSFQLRDVMTNQILFEHTVRKPEAFTVLSQRFFVIRLENDSFRGFGFAESAAACEMQEQVRKAVKPYEIQEYDRKGPNGIETSFSDKGISAVSASKEDSTIPNKGSSKIPAQPSKEEQISSVSSLEIVAFTETTKTSKWKFSWKRLTNFPYLRNWNTITAAFRWEEHEMQIGYPTDVKHVAHIGWDGPSVCGPSWIDELKPSPGFATGPLKEFGQPMGADWIHDAMSAAKWTAPGLGSMSGAPPPPPAEFLDPGMCRPQKQHSRWNVTWLLRKSKKISSDKLQA